MILYGSDKTTPEHVDLWAQTKLQPFIAKLKQDDSSYGECRTGIDGVVASIAEVHRQIGVAEYVRPDQMATPVHVIGGTFAVTVSNFAGVISSVMACFPKRFDNGDKWKN